MSSTAILFYGIGKENVPLESQEELRILLTTKGYTKVILVDWEPWRDEQPLKKFATGLGVFGSALIKVPFVGKVVDVITDYATDIPSVRKYIRSVEYKNLRDDLISRSGKEDGELVIMGHSLGTIVATQFADALSRVETTPVQLILYSPPIGYKGFHSLFKPLLNSKIRTRITLGTGDWLSKFIWFNDKKGLHPYNIVVDELYANHDLTQHLMGEVKNSPPLGNLFKKIKESL